MREQRPRLVLVGGDANTNLAAALAARKLHIALGHVEAGLRSFDWRMPEEHNRVIIDHISEYLFAPTQNAADNLRRESVRGQIHVVGNTIVDAVHEHFAISRRKSRSLERLGLVPHSYMLMTVHREENTDNEANLEMILEVVERIVADIGKTIVFPLHPRTRKRVSQFGLDRRLTATRGLVLTEPLGYLDFLCTVGSASLVLTDSGGVQQEACILGVPCLTLRDTTEWTETVAIGANVVTGLNPERVVQTARTMLARTLTWTQPFGDGKTAQRICSVVEYTRRNGVSIPMTPSS